MPCLPRPTLPLSVALLLTLSSGLATAQSAPSTRGTLAGADLAPAELGLPSYGTITPGSNQAYVAQATELGTAFVTQSGSGNYASITQTSSAPAIAVISQSGSGNRALIYQH